MPITPDTKDWTWVLERTCSECGFDVRSFPRERVGQMVRDVADNWQTILQNPRVGERPADDVWSALEYACHVRDVFDLYDRRLQMMLEQENPLYPNWDQDATALEKRYGDEEPGRVSDELGRAAESLASRFEVVRGAAWDRRGRRSDGAEFTVETFARYFIHDPIHHVHDAELGFRRLGT